MSKNSNDLLNKTLLSIAVTIFLIGFWQQILDALIKCLIAGGILGALCVGLKTPKRGVALFAVVQAFLLARTHFSGPDYPVDIISARDEVCVVTNGATIHKLKDYNNKCDDFEGTEAFVSAPFGEVLNVREP